MATRWYIWIIVAGVVFAACPPTYAAKRALLVGVEEYANPEFNLKGVREDVRLLKEALVRRGIFTASEIKTLIDKDATRDGIVRAFKDWLIHDTKPGDLTLFYFSGHGIQVWDENGDEIQDGKDEAILPYDTKVVGEREKRTFRSRTSFAFSHKAIHNFLLDDDIGELLKEMKGRTVIFLSDSCHSGSTYKRVNPLLVQYKTLDRPVSYKSVFEPRAATPVVETSQEKTNIGNELRANSVNIAAFTASEDSQPAEVVLFDREPKGYHSVFTWHLVHGLEGKAGSGDGKITLGKLARYLGEEVKQGGYMQVPQHDFQPKALDSFILVSDNAASSAANIARPLRLSCALKADAAIRSDEVALMRSQLQSAMPYVELVSTGRAACMVEVGKSGGSYGARFSDSTGSYWEPHHGPDPGQVLQDVAKDVRGYYVQSCVAALRPSTNDVDLDLTYTVKGPSPRNEGEIVKGDFIDFRVKSTSSGYLLIFSVDTVGTIYPLYPGRDGKLTSLGANQSFVVPEGERLIVDAPYGRDLIFAVLTKAKPESLARFWTRDQIGDPDSKGLTGQVEFLDALWNEFTQSGPPRKDWASRSWTLRSFQFAR